MYMKMGIIYKKMVFLYAFQMRWLHFSVEKMVWKTWFWKSYINTGLAPYFEYQHRENTTIGGITILSTFISLLLLFILYFAFTAVFDALIHIFIFFIFFFLLSCLLRWGANCIYTISISFLLHFYFIICSTSLIMTDWSDCNCGCRRFLHMGLNPQ